MAGRAMAGPARAGPVPAGAASGAAGHLAAARRLATGLYPHQIEGVAFLLGRRRSILADDMGLGKTRQAALAMAAAVPAGPYLVVCPASVKHNWARELRLALPDSEVRIVGPGGPPAAGFRGWAIVNYDLLHRDEDALLALGCAGFVFDEGHYIKNHRSRRSQLARRLVAEAAGSPVVHVLTGTPLTNRPRDLFPLLQLVDHPLGRSFLAFARRYCDGHKNDYGYWQTGGASHEAELAVQLQGVMLRRSKDEVLDLPAKQRNWIEMDVDAGVRQALDEATERFAAAERTERGGRLGIAMFSGARRRLAVAKVPHTLDFVRGAVAQGEKVVLFSCFTHATRRFARALGEEAVTVTGEVPTDKRQALVDRFQNDDSVRVFIGQIHAAGVGINLTAARQVVFNDLDWVPANHWQAEDRTHRIGQRGTVNVTYMIARQTLEAFVRTVLERKARLVDDVVEGRVLGPEMAGDVLGELRRLIAHLDGLNVAADEDAESLLRQATERYLQERAETAPLAEPAREALAPAAEAAVRALAAALAGPEHAVYWVPSASNPKQRYRVEVLGADVACDCNGFTYRGMCRHARTLKDALAAGQPPPAAYSRVEAAA